jgi:hypothetical protein
MGLVPMSASAQAAFAQPGPVLALLPGNIGYADLSRLDPSAVDSMFATFRDTRAIVFDGRNHGEAGAEVESHLPTADASKVDRRAGSPVVLSPELSETHRDDSGSYQGLTVLLVDGRTFSAAEGFAIRLKRANGTVWVGTPTAGANGSITTVVLPGGISANFTGTDVRLPDGGPYQRIGLIPDIEVAPSIAGIRAGRDEVLEKAVEYLRSRRE